MPSPNEDIAFDVDEASAEVLRDLTENVGALVAGRRLFDITNGWNDTHPAGAAGRRGHPRPTRRTPPSGGPRRPSSTASRRRSPRRGRSPATRTSRSPAPTSSQQALDLGLVDEVCVSLVPVLFGEGIPYFSKLDRGHLLLEDPVVVQGAAPSTSGTRSAADRRPPRSLSRHR